MTACPFKGNEENLSAVLHDIKDLRLENRELPAAPGPNEVLLKTHTVGICGSDVHYWQRGAIGDFVVKAPMILGHETSATVMAVGAGVKNLKAGDRVAVEPGVPCRHCKYCKEGFYNLCADIIFAATPPVDGTLTRYFKHYADFCFKLPDHVSFEEGAMLEPLSVAVHACKRGNVSTGQKVLICGAGPIGLVTLLTAKSFGADMVVITDIAQHRLDLAKKFGADVTLLIDPKDTPQETAKKVHDALRGDDPDVTLECSGAESSVKLAIYSTKSGGCILLVGMGPPEIKIPILSAAVREIDIRGIFRYRNCYPLALWLVSTKKINLKPLISHRFALEDTLKAFETARTGAGNAVKILIHCDNNFKIPQM